MMIKKATRFSWFNLCWRLPYPIAYYEAIRFGEMILTSVTLLGVRVGVYDQPGS